VPTVGSILEIRLKRTHPSPKRLYPRGTIPPAHPAATSTPYTAKYTPSAHPAATQPQQPEPFGASPPIYKYRNIIDRTEELVKLKNKHKEALNPGNRRKKRKVTKNRTFKTEKRRNTLSVLLHQDKAERNAEPNPRFENRALNEIKKELVKQGLIRVGTTTPSEVLRQMYESMKLICGNVKNHNPENLLYNFINDDT
jgi:hypothetical protein